MRRETRVADSDNPSSYEARRSSTSNVVIVGETGVGKSSVVNLIAGELLADVSSSASGCTMEATSYDVILPDDKGLNHHIRLFDTVGLNEPSLSKTDYLTAIEKANTLICQLQHTGGIRLLLFCIRGGRITAMMQKNYRLFRDILCQNTVPLAFVITGLENEASMEGFWEQNVSLFEAYGLSCASHACVTAIRGLNNCYAERYYESQKTIRIMLLAHMTGGGTSWQPERAGWPVSQIRSIIQSRQLQTLTAVELARQLRDKCHFSALEAGYLASRIVLVQENQLKKRHVTVSYITVSIVSLLITMAFMNDFSASCPTGIPVSHCTPGYYRYQTFKSTPLHSIHGNTIISRTLRHY